ncbi:MAG: YihY/virulence factor BrkB family protein [Candidatus Rokubacteria bacterium]|nr:YihY/virulence factor BrkB family protein [Candidatus Rokubacteria bacterium]
MTGLFRDAVRCFWTNDGFFLAAGLSFYVVICIVPFSLLLVAGGGFLLSDETVVREVVNQLTEILPVYQADVERILTSVAQARKISGLLGTVILLLFASQLFAATRFVLNRVFALKGRTFVHGLLFDVWMILLLTLLFFLTMGITAAFLWTRRLVSLLGHGRLFATLFEWVGLFLAILSDTALFVVLYRFVPIQRIRWPSVLAGSVIAAVLWEIAKQLFRFYIEGIGVYSTLYGSLGVTIALIMWIYYSAIVFVVGAVLIRAVEDRRRGPTVV